MTCPLNIATKPGVCVHVHMDLSAGLAQGDKAMPMRRSLLGATVVPPLALDQPHQYSDEVLLPTP